MCEYLYGTPASLLRLPSTQTTCTTTISHLSHTHRHLILIINTTDSYGHVRMHVYNHLVFKELNGIANVTATYTGTRGHITHPSDRDQRTHNTSLRQGPEDTQHIPHTGTRGHTTHPLHWDQRTHNTSLRLGPEDTLHILHLSHRGPGDTLHIPYTGTAK